jgi:multidrug efflux pump
MYIGFGSDVLASNEITDYLTRVVQPRMQAVEGVQTAEMIGAKNFALRAWLNPQKLAAYSLTAADVAQALAVNDFIAGLGTTKGQMVQVNLNASTGLHSLDEFKNLIVKQSNGAIVRLQDVATVSLGSDDYESQVAFDGKKAVYIGIKVAPAASLLKVIHGVRAIFPGIVAQLPQGLRGEIVYDSTKFVQSSIDEVFGTLLKTLLIVTLVVFAFLGSPRSVVIPVVAIPLSLIGTFVIMLIMSYSINLLTLLALVLAIGLVVDDAIIVVENVNRHIENGSPPLQAAIEATRELAGPIIAMTIVLASAYLPIGLQEGLTGALFTEFAFTLVGSVTISAVVALTLSPMLSSRMLKPHGAKESGWEHAITALHDQLTNISFIAFAAFIKFFKMLFKLLSFLPPFIVFRFFRKSREANQEQEKSPENYGFDSIRRYYERKLHSSLDYIPVTVVFALIVLTSIFFLFSSSKKELAPQEDQGVVIAFGSAAPNATLQQRQLYSAQVFKILHSYPETDSVFQLDMPGSSIAGAVFKPWNERKRTSNDLQPIIQNDLGQVAGSRAGAGQPPSLPGSFGLPLQFVLQTTGSFNNLNEVATQFMNDAQKSGMFMFLDKDLKIDQPQATLEIDRDKTAQLGLTMADVGGAMGAMLGGGYVNYFNMAGRSYKVIPQVDQKFRLNTDQLSNYYIRSGNGAAIPLSTVAHIVTSTVPETLNHFQQQNSATIQGLTMPGITLGDAIKYLNSLAERTLPQGYSVGYAGASRQYVQESNGFIWIIMLAIVIIFLTLAAQFESFRDPVIILVSVPMSIAGALIFINLGFGGATINIYTQVGLVTLMGLISKHGILIVEFANHLQMQGRTKREAIEEATAIRLRPILMTTAAMVLGVLPLILASGAGAISRFQMGLVIATGLSIGTLFTLFVVPAAYMLIAADHHKIKAGAPEEHPVRPDDWSSDIEPGLHH